MRTVKPSGEAAMEMVYSENNQPASEPVTVNDATDGAVYEDLENESGYSSIDMELPYSRLERSTRELPPPPTDYDRLPRHDYANSH